MATKAVIQPGTGKIRLRRIRFGSVTIAAPSSALV